MALVSVVMPVFNGAEVLREQLISLVHQDFRDPWELIAADNGSSDASLEVIDEFAQELPLRIIDASARSGNAAARNLGAAAATGDLILFCDQDDAVDPHWISSHLACLSDADISIGPYEMRTDMALAESGSYVSVPMRGTYGFLPYGLSANMGIRRSTFDILGGFDEMYPAACDVDICWRAQLQGLALGVTEDAVVTKRKRHRAGDLWRQHYTFGCDDVRLYSNFRRHGMPRSLPLAVKTYSWLLVHTPYLFHQQRRLHWIGVAARRMGRVAGSIRNRLFFF